MTVGEIVAEPLRIHGMARGNECDVRVDAMLEKREEVKKSSAIITWTNGNSGLMGPGGHLCNTAARGIFYWDPSLKGYEGRHRDPTHHWPISP